LAIAFGALMLRLILSFRLGGKELTRDIPGGRFKLEGPLRRDDLDHL
jgi:hypothetical protein